SRRSSVRPVPRGAPPLLPPPSRPRPLARTLPPLFACHSLVATQHGLACRCASLFWRQSLFARLAALTREPPGVFGMRPNLARAGHSVKILAREFHPTSFSPRTCT